MNLPPYTLCLLAALLSPQVAVAQSLFAEPEELPPAAQPAVPDFAQPEDALARQSVEVVRERYDNRRVKVEREVVQDEDQNYVNHGKWKQWDANGKVLLEGRYKYNQKHGVWTRLYYTRENKLLSLAPFNRGQLPIYSQAHFKEGKLHGKWVIFDAHKRKLCEWDFSEGRRHGTSLWWYVSGEKMRQITYDNGTIHGSLLEWDRHGQAVAQHQYIDGQRLAPKEESFDNGSRKSHGTMIYPPLVLDKMDDWDNCELATYTQTGEPLKHGEWKSWYPNGQQKVSGRYDHDVPAGSFVWWHQNGQKSLEASYASGKKNGTWTWWHANGIKSIQGTYTSDAPAGDWLWWHETGKVAQRADFDDPTQRHILAMPAKNDLPKSPVEIEGEPRRHSVMRSTKKRAPDADRAIRTAPELRR